MNLRLGHGVHRVSEIADGAATTMCERSARLPESHERAAFPDVQLTDAEATCDGCEEAFGARQRAMEAMAR